MRTATAGGRAAGAALVALLLSLGAVACGGSSEGSEITSSIGSKGHSAIVSDPANRRVTLTVGARSSTEQAILGEVYAQALEAAGYRVKRRFGLGAPAAAHRAVESGRVSGYPEYSARALTSFFNYQFADVPGYPKVAHKHANDRLEKEGLTAFPPTPFARDPIVAVLRETSREFLWRNLFRVEHRTDDLILYGPPGCQRRADCLVGLERNYSLSFRSFVPVERRRRYEVLETGEADFSFVTSTDAMFAADDDKFMMLTDTKEALPAENVIFLTTPAAARRAGPDYEATIVAVQEGMSLQAMQELLARVELEGRPPAAVAARYLRSAGYTG